MNAEFHIINNKYLKKSLLESIFITYFLERGRVGRREREREKDREI